MKKLRDRWENLRSSLWFFPTLAVLIAVLLAVALIRLAPLTSRQHLTERWRRLFGAGATGSRGLLAAIASSMITVAGVTGDKESHDLRGMKRRFWLAAAVTVIGNALRLRTAHA